MTEPALDRLTWRPVADDDLPALARLLAAIEAVDRTGENYDEADLAEELADPLVDVSRDTLVAAGPDGEVVAYGGLRGLSTARDVDRIWLDGGVHPAMRGRGLGRRVLDWQLRRGAEQHRERRPEMPGQLLVGVYDTAPSRAALVRASGFEPVRYFNDMERDLAVPLPPVPPVPDGLRLVRFDRKHDEATRLAHGEAFADHWGSSPPDQERWKHWYTGAQGFRPEVSSLVLDGEEVAGYLLSYFYAADAAATGVREGWVGQLGTRPGWRRRGLGSLLLATALRAYAAAGYQQAGLDVDSENPTGALGLYERLGFTVAHRWVAWSKTLAPPPG